MDQFLSDNFNNAIVELGRMYHERQFRFPYSYEPTITCRNEEDYQPVIDLLLNLDTTIIHGERGIILSSPEIIDQIQCASTVYEYYDKMAQIIKDVHELYPQCDSLKIVVRQLRIEIEGIKCDNPAWGYLQTLLYVRGVCPRCIHPLVTAVTKREHEVRKILEDTHFRKLYSIDTYKCISFRRLVEIKLGAARMQQIRRDMQNLDILKEILPRDCIYVIGTYISYMQQHI